MYNKTMVGENMKKQNNRGFTLVELLTVFVILGIIMLVAIPNVMGILDKNKKSTYIQNAKQMITLAEYKLSANATIPKPSTGQIVVFPLGCLDHTELEKGPEGGNYDLNQSFVALYNSGGTYQYWVTLREVLSGKKRGIPLLDRSTLNKEDAITLVADLNTNYSLTTGGTIPGMSGTIIYICQTS